MPLQYPSLWQRLEGRAVLHKLLVRMHRAEWRSLACAGAGAQGHLRLISSEKVVNEGYDK